MIHVVGEILIDEFVLDGQNEKLPGGAPFNVASNIKSFGGDVSFYGSVGKDENGLFLVKVANSKKFNKLILKKLENRETTIAKVTLSNGERNFKFIRDNGTDFIYSLSKVKKLNIEPGDIVHLGSLLLDHSRGRSFFKKAVEYIKGVGAEISFDINYRSDIFRSENQAKRIFKSAIKYADYIKISSDELSILSNKKRFENQVKDLVKENQKAFISLGSSGSCFYFNNKFIYQDTIRITPVDTTGAGDAFYSYVLFELSRNKCLIEDESAIKNVLLKANVVGALATQKKGAIGVVPSIEEIEKIFKEYKN